MDTLEHMISLDISAFILDRHSRGLSKNTLLFYGNELKFLYSFCISRNINSIPEITPSIIRESILDLSTRRNPGGIHAFYRAIKAFFRWYENESDLPGWKNPIKKIQPPRMSRDPIPGITVEVFKKLISTCNGSDFLSSRNKAVLFVLYDTGIRVSELCGILLQDINMQSGSVFIRNGKGSKSRTVSLGIKSRREVLKYLRKRELNPGPLFTHRDRVSGLAREAIRSIILQASKSSGIEPPPSPHDFRRAYALEMLRAGTDIFTLSRLMGHSDIQVLRRYLALTDSDSLSSPSIIDNL